MPIVHARTAEAVEEERRLMYGAVTRARVHLALSWAPARTPGTAASRQRSRFLSAVDAAGQQAAVKPPPGRAAVRAATGRTR
jgi:DNA helicase-2/ATP-dependent DNA helicase PcrA